MKLRINFTNITSGIIISNAKLIRIGTFFVLYFKN